MSFITDDFLLQSEPARRLYHEYAAEEPIFDYHCHLPPADIAENRRFSDLAEIWLGGDHYKWRAMRANGVDERFCTGDASPYEKFKAFCETVPHTLRNPLFHWCHLELKRYFGIDLPVNGDNAREIWERANEQLKQPEFRAHGILKRFHVKLVGTTDDPTDELEAHRKIQSLGLETQVIPTFRPDKGLQVENPEAFNDWCDRLGRACDREIQSWEDFLEALRERHDAFHEMGGRSSDHGLNRCCFAPAPESTLASIFDKARKGTPADPLESEQWATCVLQHVGRWNHERGWVMQFHLGAMRSNNARKLAELGPDTGFDSIGDWRQGEKLSRFLDSLDREDSLPKVVLYNLNPSDNYLMATMIGNFQDGSIAGKIQFGSGWWFLDQKEAMEWQMNALSNNGLLSRFIGMLTDSRSFMSYCRHEYFRRVLCNLVGQDIHEGILPDDLDLSGEMIRRICYRNAVNYFFGEDA